MRNLTCYNRLSVILLTFAFTSTTVFAQEDASGFKPLFNGKDLTGWVPVNTAPSTWTVKEQMLVCSGKPIGELRTNRMYQNFVLEVEWRHMVPKGNAGIFVWADDITAKGQPFHRSVEVQVLENAYGNTRGYTTHGDIFPIHGAKMTPINGRGGSRAFPIENRSKPSPEWNHYRITCNNGEISLAVNGKVVTRGKDCSPRKGYICIESEGGIVHYRNMRIKELPATPVDRKGVAIANRGYRCLYTGIDLSGWKTTSTHWTPRDWVLHYGGAGSPDDKLETDETFTKPGFLFDMRQKEKTINHTVSIAGMDIVIGPKDPEIQSLLITKARGWNRIEGRLMSNSILLTINGKTLPPRPLPKDAPQSTTFSLSPGSPVDFANLFIRETK